ncbi:hypothetical protein IWW57_006502, partial [Coemansia sp. S610]
LVFAFVVVAVLATNQPVNWGCACTDAAIITNWSQIRTRLATILPSSAGMIGTKKHDEVYKLLKNSYYLPTTPDLKLEEKLFTIVGADYMQYAIGEILNKYWKKYPCDPNNPVTSTSTKPTSSKPKPTKPTSTTP